MMAVSLAVFLASLTTWSQLHLTQCGPEFDLGYQALAGAAATLSASSRGLLG